eukprot:scaffold2481_cov145-Skeletonema_menzelii.AAC.13
MLIGRRVYFHLLTSARTVLTIGKFELKCSVRVQLDDLDWNMNRCKSKILFHKFNAYYPRCRSKVSDAEITYRTPEMKMTDPETLPKPETIPNR